MGAAVSEANKQLKEAREYRAAHAYPRYQPPATQQPHYQPQRTQPQALSLQPDERCIGKQKFRRVANGWEQIGSC